MIDWRKIDKTWTLFLDRDGVINHEKHLDYVYSYVEFEFYDGVLQALKTLSARFGKMIIVTNQRGVEKKLMTETALVSLHNEMLQDIRKAGGEVDAIYYCTSLDDNHPNRKPQIGMALLARERFPEIDFRKSIMVGNNLSDMQFGKNAGMYTVFVKTTSPGITLPHPLIDLAVEDLPTFANLVESAF